LAILVAFGIVALWRHTLLFGDTAPERPSAPQ
jgi:hypothetical protein